MAEIIISCLGLLLQKFFNPAEVIDIIDFRMIDEDYDLLLIKLIRETHFHSIWIEDLINKYTARNFHKLFKTIQDTYRELLTALSVNSGTHFNGMAVGEITPSKALL